jgi:methyl-accepting chemotaxis protein
MNDLSVKAKLQSIIVFFCCVLMLFFSYSYLSMQKIKVTGEIYKTVSDDKDLIADILPPPLYIIEGILTAYQLAGTADEAARTGLLDKAAGLRRDYETRQDHWKSALPAGRMKDLLAGRSAEPARRFFEVFFGEFASALKANDGAKARAILDTRLRPLFEEHRKAIDELAELGSAEVARIEREAAAQAASSVLYMVVLGLAALAVSVVVPTIVARRFVGSIGTLVAYATAVSAGRLDERLDLDQKDEVGVLADRLRAMVRSLKEQIGAAAGKGEEARAEAAKARQAMDEAERARLAALQRHDSLLAAAGALHRIAETVGAASEALAAQIGQSSAGAEVQSRRVGETAASMEQMNGAILDVARSAGTAAATAEEARRKAEDGSEVVAGVVGSIDAAQARALGLKDDMAALGGQAESIGRIMTVISDIADQTNLLALNAAIEAARAGDAGRGFAVVADEVRKLAEKTMTATKEVGQAIQGIQQGTRRNMDGVDQAVRAIEQATALTGRSGEALRTIVTLVDRATDQVRSIASASEQQSAASEEINRSIEDIHTLG